MRMASSQPHSADVLFRSRWFPRPLMSVLLIAAFAVAGIFFIGGHPESGAGNKQAEGGRLFDLMNPERQNLNAKQKKHFERIKKSVAAVDVKIVRLNAELLSTKPGKLVLPLTDDKSLHMPDTKVIAVKGTEMEAKGRLDLIWKGSSVTQFASFSVRGKTLTGLIYDENKLYSVESIGDGLQALILLDPTKFKPDHPREFEAILRNKIQNGPPPAAEPPPPNAKTVTVRVLVAYTPRVDEMEDDVQSLIADALKYMNDSCKNSRVNLHTELAGTMKVNYMEKNMANDLAAFQQMPDVKKVRKQKQADICVLLVDNNDKFAGMAAAILADVNTAFAVVDHDEAVRNLVFPHELGHLFGARHDINEDPTRDPQYPWNHGFVPPNANWRTMMAYRTGRQLRVPYWSNPHVTYDIPPRPMGTMATEYDARMLNSTAETVSKFRNAL